jgi:hypothetical protein
MYTGCSELCGVKAARPPPIQNHRQNYSFVYESVLIPVEMCAETGINTFRIETCAYVPNKVGLQIRLLPCCILFQYFVYSEGYRQLKIQFVVKAKWHVGYVYSAPS